MFEKIREWLQRFLRALFPPGVYDQVVQSAQGAETQEEAEEEQEQEQEQKENEEEKAKEKQAAEGEAAAEAQKDAQEEAGEKPGGKAQLKGTDNISGASGKTGTERRHILFFGRVQGVGFRYHAMYGARNYGLTGWVENLYDGSVEMEVQGSAAAIDRMIGDIGRNGRWIFIERIQSEIIPVVEGERGFHVRGY